jgi:hypothetical protein
MSSGLSLKKSLKTSLQTLLSNFVLSPEPGYVLTYLDKAYMSKSPV